MVKECPDITQSKGVPADNSWFTASTYHTSCPPYHARLDTTGSCSGWRSGDYQYIGQWIQIYFAKDIIAHEVIVQVSRLLENGNQVPMAG